MNWGAEDFVAAGLILGSVLAVLVLAWRQSTRIAYLMGFAAGVGALFLLVWVSLAVGIIGDGGHPANLAFALVVAVAVIGMAASRLRPRGMSRTMFLTAGLQALAGIAATFLTAIEPEMPGLPVVFAFSAMLAGAFALSGWLFGIDDGMEQAERTMKLKLRAPDRRQVRR